MGRIRLFRLLLLSLVGVSSSFAADTLVPRGALAVRTNRPERETTEEQPVEAGPVARTSTAPTLRIETVIPAAVNVGQPAVFVIQVRNTSDQLASGVEVSTTVPDHVELERAEPEPIDQTTDTLRFEVGDIAPKSTQRVTLLLRPSEVGPIDFDTKAYFTATARTSLVVQQPVLTLESYGPGETEVGKSATFNIVIVNTGDGPAQDVVLHPSLADSSDSATAITVGTIPPGGARKVKVIGIPQRRGEMTARFVASNQYGLSAETTDVVRIRQPELVAEVAGPRVKNLGRDVKYTVRVANEGDAATAATEVVVALPNGLTLKTVTEKGARYNKRDRTITWKLPSLEAGEEKLFGVATEASEAGDQEVSIVASAGEAVTAEDQYVTNVISRPNLLATVINKEGTSEVGEPMEFQIVILNTGTRAAEAVDVRVTLPQALEVVPAEGYTSIGDTLDFEQNAVLAGKTTTLTFHAIGRLSGDHRVRVAIDSPSLEREIAVEGSAFCYANDESSDRNARQPVRSQTPRLLPR